ncbi:MAG: acetyl-CoA C-acetyltransferase [Saprospiraceae bacterium]|nr:acetyl-CoA C-acetyltransferase [Saprospiraceae bacterium]
MAEAFIYDTLRTPRGKGKVSGALYEVRPVDLISQCLQAMRDRNTLETTEVDDLLLGCVTPIGGQGYNIAKAGLLYAGWADTVPGIQLNRYCSSGLEAVNFAAVQIRADWRQLLVAGGVESMSRIPIGSDGGALLNDPDVINRTGSIPQGIAADLIASLNGFSREDLDTVAFQSNKRATNAWESNYFEQSVIPVYDRNGIKILDRDEHFRPNTSMESLGALSPVFKETGAMGFDEMALSKYPELEQIHHLHTAGNSSGIVDGSALVLLGNEAVGKRLKLKPRARIVSAATISSEPTLMLGGPVPAALKALKIAGLQKSDIDLWEVNEAFAAIPLQFQKALDLDPEVVNVNGGAIAMGHPLGATGAILLGILLDELERRKMKRGLVCLCAGSGIGIATIIERI